MHVMALVRDLGKCSTSKGASYIIFMIELDPKCLQSSWKQSVVVKQHD